MLICHVPIVWLWYLSWYVAHYNYRMDSIKMETNKKLHGFKSPPKKSSDILKVLYLQHTKYNKTAIMIANHNKSTKGFIIFICTFVKVSINNFF